jgi:hypothetical protein
VALWLANGVAENRAVRAFAPRSVCSLRATLQERRVQRRQGFGFIELAQSLTALRAGLR